MTLDEFEAMFVEMSNHGKSDGPIVRADQPIKLLIGWDCLACGMSWTFRIAEIKKLRETAKLAAQENVPSDELAKKMLLLMFMAKNRDRLTDAINSDQDLHDYLARRWKLESFE